MEIKDKMESLLKKQREVVQANYEFESERNKLETEIKQEVKKELEIKFENHRFEILPIFNGSKSEGWTPRVSIYTVNRAQYTDIHQWKRDEAFFETNDGISVMELQQFLSTFQEKLGIKVELYIQHVKTADDVKMIRNLGDLKLKYEGIEVLKEGKVWHKGWDIADIFFITKYKDDYVLFLSENGHGFGIDLIFKKEDGEGMEEDFFKSIVNRFFKFIELDKDNKYLREKYETEILNNWLK